MSKLKYSFITDFEKSREKKIGASDIPALIPHPLRPTESLAGYGQTAITLYEEKIGVRPRTPAGFSAAMGHYLEPIILREFINDVLDKKVADEFYKGYMENELALMSGLWKPASLYNKTQFYHHTEATTEYGVAHADCVYEPPSVRAGNWEVKIADSDLTVDLSKLFLIQAKSAQYWATLRRDDRFSGYDFSMSEWQGIPLKHYMQMQYEMSLYGADVSYLVLLYNTSEKHYWQVKANKKHQASLLETAELMKKCIDKKKPPRELAMNATDIRKLYPDIKEDFTELIGDELTRAIDIAKEYNKAVAQEKIWKEKKEDAENAIAILLKDQRRIRGLVDDKMQTIAEWKSTGGFEKIKALKEIKSEYSDIYEYLKNNEMIEFANSNEKPAIKLKFKD